MTSEKKQAEGKQPWEQRQVKMEDANEEIIEAVRPKKIKAQASRWPLKERVYFRNQR